MSKFFIKITLILIMFGALICHTAVFAICEDISAHWAEETIINFFEKGYLYSGDIQFIPDAEITKGELATIVNHYFDYGYTKNEEDNLKIAEENGYLSNSGVMEKITREEVAVIICKVLSLSPIEETTNFLDNESISIWSMGYVSALEKNGIIIGYPNQTYKPQKNITKAEFVTILNRCVGIGGSDIEFIESENNKLEVGIFSMENGEIRFIPIDGEISLKTGENVQIALKVPEEIPENEIVFEIISENNIVFDKETYILTALQEGKSEMLINAQEYFAKIGIIVE